MLAPFACLALGWSVAKLLPASGNHPARNGAHEIPDSPRKGKARGPSRLPTIKPEILEAAASLDYPFPAPYKDSFVELLRSYHEKGSNGPAKLVIALETWLANDQDGCLKFLASGWTGDVKMNQIVEAIVVRHADTLSDADLHAFVRVFRLAGAIDSISSLLQLAAERTWTGGPDATIKYSKTLPAEITRAYIMQASSVCPEIHRPEWAARLLKLGDTSSLKTLVSVNKTTAKPWLDKLIADNPQSARMFEATGIYDLVKYQPDEGRSLEKTLDDLEKQNHEDQGPGDLRKMELNALTLARTADVREKLASTHRHLLDQYMEGTLTTEALLKSLGSDLPELAKANSAQMQTELLPILASANPQAAMRWIADLPLREKTNAVYDAVQRCQNPESRVAILAAYPYEPAQGPLQRRFQLMAGITAPGSRQFGNSYAEWLLAMPPGQDRRMGLSALAHDIRYLDPDLSKRLNEVK